MYFGSITDTSRQREFRGQTNKKIAEENQPLLVLGGSPPAVLVQIKADNVVGFKFIRDRAVAQAGDHGRQTFALLHEIFRADGVKEALTDGDIAEMDTAAGGMSGHARILI